MWDRDSKLWKVWVTAPAQVLIIDTELVVFTRCNEYVGEYVCVCLCCRLSWLWGTEGQTWLQTTAAHIWLPGSLGNWCRKLQNRKEKEAWYSTFLHSPKHLTPGLTNCWQTETSAGKLTLFLSRFSFLGFSRLSSSFTTHNREKRAMTGQVGSYIVCNSFHD